MGEKNHVCPPFGACPIHAPQQMQLSERAREQLHEMPCVGCHVLRQQLTAAEAGAAALREALEGMVRETSGSYRLRGWKDARERAQKALSSTAGAELLARVDKMREALEAWRRLCEFWGDALEEPEEHAYRLTYAALSGADTAPAPSPRWRPEIVAFADAMERKLRANDHKGGWKSCTANYLVRRLDEECEELKRSFGAPKVLDEAADVANFAMMIADACGALSGADAGRAGAEGALPTVPTIVAVIKTLGSGEQLGDFEAALDEEISGLPDDKIPRDPDFLTPSEHAKQLARRILLDLAHSFFSRSREIIPMPSLDAVTDGSIDIHWETERGELIINAPRDGEDSPISYYGHTPDRTAIIKGTLHPNEKHDFLMAWLLDR